MILSSLASKMMGAGKKQQKRQSISSSTHTTISRSIPRPSICINQYSVFEDTEIVTDTPLSKLIKKIRKLEQLTIEDIEFVNMLDRDNILMLLLEYNCSVKFIDVAKFQIK